MKLPSSKPNSKPPRRRAAWLAAAMLLTALFNASAAPFEFKSKDAQTVLLELYTSEGCSSCPPADKWLSGLKHSPALWDEFVPISFHVDYWNQLGWRDRWSRREFADRQRQYATQWRSENIYTPCYVLNGRQWRPKTAAPPAPSQRSVGVLTAKSEDGKTWTIQFASKLKGLKDPLRAHVALLGSNLNSKVRAGENSGRELLHDFVVLRLKNVPLEPTDGSFRGIIKLDEAAPAPRLAVAVWVSESGRPDALQAAGGWLED